MHRKITRISAAVIAATLLGGCAAQEKNLLSYQDGVEYADLEEGGRVWRVTPEDGGFTAVITAPEAAAGITFRLSGTEASASAAGMQIPLGERMHRVVSALTGCLALRTEEITGTRTDPPAGYTLLTFADGTSAAVSDAGKPLWFERGGVRYTVKEISMK